MFRANTVFVIGAGASYEAGLPLGSELLRRVAQSTNLGFQHNRLTRGDAVVHSALRRVLDEGPKVELMNRHIRAAWQVNKAAEQALSIDNVIDALETPEVELVGKIGIALEILRGESQSGHFNHVRERPGELVLEGFDGTWYRGLTQALTEGVRLSNIEDIYNNFSVINFNYDRSLEYYLSHSIAQYYGVELERSRELISRIKIVRPYGRVGKLPWQGGDDASVEFGLANERSVADVSGQIRTFTEQIDDKSFVQSVDEIFLTAQRVIFLGFAYHPQNMQLIGRRVEAPIEFLGTVSGISTADSDVVRREINRQFGEDHETSHRITLADTRCSQLFNDYWRTLVSESVN